jgi:hypothetical protein
VHLPGKHMNSRAGLPNDIYFSQGDLPATYNQAVFTLHPGKQWQVFHNKRASQIIFGELIQFTAGKP